MTKLDLGALLGLDKDSMVPRPRQQVTVPPARIKISVGDGVFIIEKKEVPRWKRMAIVDGIVSEIEGLLTAAHQPNWTYRTWAYRRGMKAVVVSTKTRRIFVKVYEFGVGDRTIGIGRLSFVRYQELVKLYLE